MSSIKILNSTKKIICSKSFKFFIFFIFYVSSNLIIIEIPYKKSQLTENIQDNNPNAQDEYLTLDQIWIRDPNIFYDNGTYYMTGTTSNSGFIGYSSSDLIHWKSHGFIYVRNESNYWAQYNFWAPEIVKRNDLYYMFFSGKSDNTKRATGVAVSTSPMGPYHDLVKDPLTPPEYECLDGHLFKDDNGTEYLIYVYEWVQAGIGQMWIQEISDDYTHLIGDPIVLFKGTDPSWGDRVVDGPSMLKYNGTYYLFWSTFNHNNDGKYCVGYASSPNIFGPYTQSNNPIIWNDGGHSTWFIENSTGKLKITYHEPNAGPEHAQIRDLYWDDNLNTWAVYPPDGPPINIRLIIIITIWLIMAFISIAGVIIIKNELKLKKHLD